MPASTIHAVRQRVRRFRGHYSEICSRSGLTYSWLTKLVTGERASHPSFDRINRLVSTLDAMELEGARTGRRTRKSRARKTQRRSGKR